MKILVVGGGAREHAIVWKLAMSPAVDTIYCAPGNGGTAIVAQNLDMAITTESECDQLAGWAFNNSVDLVLVGPEVPLRHGIADSLLLLGVPVMGPVQNAARIEWSKAWARQFMQRHAIPSPGFEVITGEEAILAKLNSPELSYPVVLKADGLAAGKGAAVLGDALNAQEAFAQMRVSGAVGQGTDATVVLEEFLEGYEVSALAFTDGKRVAMMPPACDYKRLVDGDQGPLTGGMGAYTPTRLVSPALWAQIETEIMQKTVDALSSEGISFKGVLYAGLMITAQGPKVLEFNCRFGDPEAQVLLPRLETPLEDIGIAIAKGDLGQVGPITWNDAAVVGVVIASHNYPIGKADSVPVSGLGDVEDGVLVFHAGTELKGMISLRADYATTARPSVLRTLFSREPRTDIAAELPADGGLTASGGRLLTVVAKGATIKEARDAVYRNVPKIAVKGAQYRSDIAARELDEPAGEAEIVEVPAEETEETGKVEELGV